MVWGTGDAAGLQAVDVPDARIGALICWEHWMPLARQALHDSGESMHVALWPTVHEMHQVACRHYAFEGRCFVLAAGSIMHAGALPPELERHPTRAGHDSTWVMRGGSAIIAPNGSYLAGPVFDEPTLLIAELDLEDVRREQMTLDVSGHYARPDCLKLTVQRGERAER
jgi:nitrilase